MKTGPPEKTWGEGWVEAEAKVDVMEPAAALDVEAAAKGEAVETDPEKQSGCQSLPFKKGRTSEMRTGRQKYYDLFSCCYDSFVNLHAGRHRDETRRFLVASSRLENAGKASILDICCGTGSVIQAFADRYAAALTIGYDFSSGMLQRARQKDTAGAISYIRGDAAKLAFPNACFDIVCCSHALYELRGRERSQALAEMKRVVKPDGMVLIMEHEVPRNPYVRILFHLRMLMMGAADAEKFLRQDLSSYRKFFAEVSVSHTPSGKSKLITCRKR